jgi:hypothetical protein
MFSGTHSPDVSGFSFLQQSACSAKAEIEKGGVMADQSNENSKRRTLSLDGWAVAVALLLAALVRLGVLKHISW